ncbi:toxin TcdB middle/N-terminal domain-containing protein [Microbacterium panaciterrae]|uniref:Toxin TcdB middle/N-terminal domain-containing protein n=1 Tax=Microbacterium panaciterrae TaxID=985759 RepID=A0ABP8PUR1_9MICO
MSVDIGFASQTPSLPGGGSAAGLGETFSPDLSTGTGTLTVPLEVPNGPNDCGPKLTLRYDSASANGPFGAGWTLALPRIVRSTMIGRPHYDDSDTLVLEGSGPLVRRADGTLTPQVATGDWTLTVAGDGFVATDRAGTRFTLGTAPEARIPGAGGAPWAWLLERIEDNVGEASVFGWRADRAQRYLDTVAYGPFTVAFAYEPRPDRLRWGRGGFLLETAERCAGIELRLPGDAHPLVRRWTLGYRQGEPNGASQLASVTMSGFAADGSSLDAPPLTFGYTTPTAPRLQAVPAIDAGATPPALGGGRVELVDWTGDGLADIIEFGTGGTARVWPNRGGSWGRPVGVGTVPALSAPDARAALVDIDGDGLADVVRSDLPLAGYQPRTADGFGVPRSWSQAPTVALGAASVRLGDLDGDGLPDLLWSTGTALLIASRTETGWSEKPLVVPSTPDGPPTDLADPRVFCADMTGDGTPDLVRVDGAGVRYWPYLGYGVFAPAVTMADAPVLPFDTNPADVLVVDLDGDGCADVLHLAAGVLTWWPNRAGDGFAPPRTIAHLPTGGMSDVRIADVLGTGAPAVAWTATLPSGRARWFAVDPCGGVHPGLLASIDNGVGRRTEIRWTTSALEAERDRSAGTPWSTRLPLVLPVVTGTTVTDAVSGPVAQTQYAYHDGRYDGVLREVCGFGRVTTTERGDADVATLVTEHRFHVGLTDAGAEPVTRAERIRARAIRGRIRRIDRRGLDPAPTGILFDRFEQSWQVVDGPDGTVVPRLAGSVKSVFEGAADPVSTIQTAQLAFDADGNVIEARERSFAGAAQTGELHTQTEYAVDPTGRYRQRVSRILQQDGSGTVLSDLRIRYDGLPAGQIGAQGLVTERMALAFTAATAADVYGAEMPDFAALGYHQVSGDSGWWVRLAAYARTDAGGVVQGTVTGPLGGVATIAFDPSGCYPVRSVDALGNVVTAEFDLRTYRPTAVRHPSGARSAAVYDALARTVATIEEGDSAAAPTVAFDYSTASIPLVVTAHRAAGAGDAPSVERQFLDGDGRIVERRRTDAQGEVADAATQFGARGLPVRTFLPRRVTGPWVAPASGEPHTAVQYDALGRAIRTVRPDGSTATVAYSPGMVEDTDASGARTRRHLDPAGHVVRIEQLLGADWIASAFEIDAKGAVSAEVDPVGNRTEFTRDLLGRTVRIRRPESEQIAVLDAANNPVESRSGAHRVFRTFDLGGRTVAVRHDTAVDAPVVQYVYHDNGATPADAGSHTDGGRLVRVDDETGTTVFDYDLRGNLARKTVTPAGGAPLTLQLAYRSDDLVTSIAYPDGTTIGYHYDVAGRLAAIDGVITAIDYDDSGRRIRTSYANGVTTEDAFDPHTGWLSASAVHAPGGTLRDVAYTHDPAGDLLQIASPDPALAWTYAYDGLHRLTGATGSGHTYAYAYDAAGNLASDGAGGGAYGYGGAGAAATLLTSVGADAYGYDDRGHLATAPWGVHTSDAEGRLRRLARADGVTEDYTYDHAGRLAVRRRTSPGGATSLVLSPDRLLRVEDGVVVLQFSDGEGIVATEKAGVRMWLHTDHLGSVVLATDAAGAVAASVAYGPFGAVLSRSGGAVAQGFATGLATEDGPGLVLLGARWYAPQLGRFLSPDSMIADVDDPLAWNLYAYCRDNPTSFVDPSGRNFWKIFAAVVATIAIIAVAVIVSVFTFGIAAPGAAALTVGGLSITWGAVFAATMIGIAAGGVIGGIAAARAGGDAGDVFLGIVVGGAVGGWAAFGAAFAGVAVAGGIGLTSGTILCGAVTGGVAGAINGAAMGFAAGFAGGKNKGIGDIMEKVLVGAVIGLVIGAAVGAVSGMVAPKTSFQQDLQQQFQTPAQGGSAASAPGAAAPAGGLTGPASEINTASGVASKLGTEAAGRFVSAAAPHLAGAFAPYAGMYAVQTAIVDLTAAGGAGFFDDIQQYVRTHNVDLGPFNFIKSDF